MGFFNDLPKDVKWLIFAHVLNESHCLFKRVARNWNCYETESEPANNFCWQTADDLKTLAQVSKECLIVIRSKCYKVGRGWLFRRGAMSEWVKMKFNF